MTETMNTMDDKRIASEEDLLTIDASTGEKTYRYITREDVNHLEAETIHMREVAQKAIDEINWEIGHRRSPFQYLFPVYRILCANLDVYRQLARELRSRAYVTLYDIYDTRVEQMWREQLAPIFTEYEALGRRVQEIHDLDRQGAERLARSVRRALATIADIEMSVAGLCHIRETRSGSEETIIYRYIKRQFEETRLAPHLARVARRHQVYLDNRKAEANMAMLRELLNRTELRYGAHAICKQWADRGYPEEEESEAFVHELSQQSFGKKDFENLFMYQVEQKLLTEKISRRNDEDHQSDPLFSHWVDPYKVEEILRFWVKANIKTKKQWYLVWCIMKYSFDIIREGQDKSDFAVRMNLMFKDAEVKCEVNSFRREEKKMNHNKHFSYWHKETDPDYSIAESLYRKLNEKDLYRK